MDPQTDSIGVQTTHCPNCGNSIAVTDKTESATCPVCGAELVVNRDASGQPSIDLAGMTVGVSSAALDAQARRRLEGELAVLQSSRIGLARVQPVLAQARRWLLLARLILFAALAVGVVVVMAADQLWIGFLVAGAIVALGVGLALISQRRRRPAPAAPTARFDEALAAREAQLRETLAQLDQTANGMSQKDG